LAAPGNRRCLKSNTMLHKINSTSFRGHGPIQVLYPGLIRSDEDSGIGSIGRIDHAKFQGRHHIAMHPHVNDEILSYFRTGIVNHRDSEGFNEVIGAKRLMLMKAGKLFQHEEDIDGENEPHEGLQIFIRPGKKDLEPEVIFQDLEELYSENRWRLIASPTTETKFQFSSRTWFYDIRLSAESSIDLPMMPDKGLTALLYTYQGAAEVNQQLQLKEQEGLIIKDEAVSIRTEKGTELVLFVTDEGAPIYKAGMYSGNQLH